MLARDILNDGLTDWLTRDRSEPAIPLCQQRQLRLALRHCETHLTAQLNSSPTINAIDAKLGQQHDARWTERLAAFNRATVRLRGVAMRGEAWTYDEIRADIEFVQAGFISRRRSVA